MPSRPAKQYSNAYWFDFIIIALVALIILLPIMCAKGGEEEESSARSALALARAARERSAKSSESQPVCYVDPDLATQKARKEKLPLVFWVGGLQCKDHPEFRKAVGDAIHCHIPNHDGDRTHRVVVMCADVEYYILASHLDKARGEKVRRMWKEPSPIIGAPRAKVIEELSYRVPSYSLPRSSAGC